MAIAAGKGGVGKSMLTSLIALSLKGKGWKVGVMDADIYGPSVRKMLPEDALPQQITEDQITPASCNGIAAISMAYLLEEGKSASVRAPIANGIIKQFIHNVAWGDLDCLLIDFPPGTGDIQLTLMQEMQLSGGVLITTPQQIALMDVQRAFEMFSRMQVPVLGVVENMSFFEDPHGKGRSYPFGEGGGKSFARESGLFFLGEIPIDPAISHCCDRGLNLFEQDPLTPGAMGVERIVAGLIEQLEAFASIEKESVKNFDLE